MYLDTDDYRTVWQLAYDWAGQDSQDNASNDPSPEVKEAIHRILVAILNKLISVRTSSIVIFEDDSFLGFVFDIRHYLKIRACQRKNRFDKKYLDSLYVWRPEVIRWCKNDLLPIPPCWQPKLEIDVAAYTEPTPEIDVQTVTAAEREIPKGITKGAVINAFEGIHFGRDQWDKYLASPPKWLEECRIAKGNKKTSATWNPALIAAALLDKGITTKELDGAFVRLPEWADEWRDASEYSR